MVRLTAAVCLIVTASVEAQPSPETDARVGKALAVQQAMNTARDHLRAGKPDEAVAALETQILFVDGNASFLALLKEAYLANLKDLRQRKAEPGQQEHIRRQLRILDPKSELDEATASPTKPLLEPETPIAEPLRLAPMPAKATANEEDPFQQIPLDRQQNNDLKVRASAAFANKRYTEAAALFDKALQAKQPFTAEERQALAYCRLHDVVTRLNNKGGVAPSLTSLEMQTKEAALLGGEALAKFSDQVLTEIRKRKSESPSAEPTSVPEGWQAFEVGSFRILFQQSRPQAQEVAKTAEQVRTATFEKWAGPVGAAWTPQCDVWLHASGADYAKATGKPAASPGHASIGTNAGKIHARRIDIRIDDPAMMEVTLPREVAYTVLADLFPDQPLPRWADVGIAMLATSDAEIARYRRAVPQFARDRKLYSVRELLKMADFPEAEKITPFYVESVSLVDYLVRLKGAKAFALYLREAPRRGYEEALQRHYGIKDALELQERWLRASLGAE